MDEAHAARSAAHAEVRKLEAEITELAAHLTAASYRFLRLIAEFDRRKGWSDWATKSCAHWLNWKLGVDLKAAYEKVRVARALEGLPRIAAAMARGELSYSKVRALTRVAEPATEEALLSIALHGTAQHVEKLVRGYRRAREAEELSRDAQQQETRRVIWYHDRDGSWVLRARLPAESGELVLQALEVALKQLPLAEDSRESSAEDTAGQRAGMPTRAQRRADALGIIAESFLQHGLEALNGGDRQQIVVHVDAETLQQRSAGRCELAAGPPLPAETARRLACDASVVRIVENAEGEPLDVGRKTRSIPSAIRRALKARDQGCRFPGCTHRRYVDGHHIEHWAEGGETKLRNLVSLCRFHHRLVHEGGIRIGVLDDGALQFLKPDGELFEDENPEIGRVAGDWRALVAAHRRQALAIDAGTAVTRWRGEAMDYGLAVQALLQRSARGRNAATDRYCSARYPSS